MTLYKPYKILFLNQNEKYYWTEYHYEDYENLPIALIDNKDHFYLLVRDNQTYLPIAGIYSNDIQYQHNEQFLYELLEKILNKPWMRKL